ncbi:MAG TPA: exopolygalacturonase [Lachnospiraceae bacterium]|nr:exopolygalacturonase [Lachnospiraceae bacterium]
MAQEYFPDGTRIDEWFYDTQKPSPDRLGKRYRASDYGLRDDGRLHTQELQALIDRAFEEGGGVIVIPAGTYLTGPVWFRQGVHLCVEEGGVLKGSDNIADYPVMETRIEGESCKYFPGLINADGLDGFTICGKGSIDGNGLRSWESLWLRRKWKPDCLNKDEQRARLVYISNCKNVTFCDIHFQNSQFWTTHIYKSDHVKYLDCSFFSPREPVKAPSTDAIDIDACSDVLIKGCYMHVNDDAVALKGGKGPDADRLSVNGANERIIIEDCVYGFCHGCLVLGSESIHDRNILLRRIRVDSGYNLLWLKMRPDTPQHYEYVTVEDIKGTVNTFINVNPWTQFYDLKGMEKPPVSKAEHIAMRRCEVSCMSAYFITPKEDEYLLSDFTFEELKLDAKRMTESPI